MNRNKWLIALVLLAVPAAGVFGYLLGRAARTSETETELAVRVPFEAPHPITPELVARLNILIDEGDSTGVADLLRTTPKLAEARDKVRATPLITAAYRGDVEICRLLMLAGADVNARKEDGWSALHFAVERDEMELAQLLLDNGADPNIRKNDDGTPLHAAVRQGRLEMARLLIAKGADVNARKKDGWTPLRFARTGKHEAVEQFLVEHGATE